METVEGLGATRKMLQRKQALWNERSSWVEHWREISLYQQPRVGRFLTSDVNKGGKKSTNVIDNTAIWAARTLAAGMMSGMTSPARPWFKLELDDTELMENAEVKEWLHKTTRILRAIFASSNTYRTLHTLYGELGYFGSAADIVLPNFENVIHHHPLTIGEYALGTDHEGKVNTLCREYKMTVGQMVQSFGIDAVSETVKSLYQRQSYDSWVDVVHMVCPREQYDSAKRDAKNMPWASCYFEPGQDQAKERCLRESGFKRFRVLAPRWTVNSNNVYGDSPGMDCLGDVKQLQHQQLRKGEAIDYMVRPPLQVPTRYREAPKARLPGGIFYVDQAGPAGGVRSAYDVRVDLSHLSADIVDVRGRIKQAYYADLFLMLAQDTRSGITATEVTERHEEKLLMLGPVLERLDNELLRPMIDLAMEDAAEARILPEAPRMLQGRELKVTFIGVLAQAQRLVAVNAVDQVVNRAMTMAQAKPEVLDKVDFDQVLDDTADMFGINPNLIVPDDKVTAIRAQRAQQAAAAQAAAAAPAVADTAKTVGDTNVQGVQDVMNLFSGYNSPGAQSL